MKKMKQILVIAFCLAFLTTNSVAAFAETKTVNATASVVLINGVATDFEAYLIDDSNYFKLRDLAFSLNGANKQFEVGYDDATAAITMTTGQAYTPLGGEMAKGDGAAKTATLNAAINIALNGEPVDIVAYLIEGNNFMKLRDVMQLLDVYVGYDEATRNITIDASRSYEAGPTGASAASAANSGKEELIHWITATAALRNYINTGEYRLIELPRTEELKALSLSILGDEQWGIKNASELREQIAALTYVGHREAFDELYQLVRDDPKEVADYLTSIGVDDVDLGQLELIKKIGDKWEYRSIAAWDLFRVGTLVSWGYMAGYLETDEACRLMEPVVSQLKFNFSDWDEAMNNYLDGYSFWSHTDPASGLSEYQLRKLKYSRLKSENPALFDDSLFTQPLIVNLQKTTLPTPESIRGYWKMQINGARTEFTQVLFYFDREGNAASLYEHEGNQLLCVGLYAINYGAASVAYTYMSDGEYVASSEYDGEILGGETFLFCMSADGKQLIAVDVFTGDSYVFDAFDGAGFPEIAEDSW